MLGTVPTTPDPNTSAKLSRYKWEAYGIQIGSVYTTLCQEEGILWQKYRDRNGRCIAIPFKSIGVGDRLDSADHACKKSQAPIKSAQPVPARRLHWISEKSGENCLFSQDRVRLAKLTSQML